MQRLIGRIIVALGGLLGAFLFIVAWGDPAQLDPMLGVAASKPLGLASIRADLGAFFALWAAFALVAAWRADRGLLMVPMLLLALAIAGRVVTLFGGMTPDMIQPIVIEAVTLALFALAWRLLGPVRR